MIGNLYVHTKDDRRYLFVREETMLSPFAFDRHRWKLVVSGYEMSEKDVLILLDTLGYLEFSMPRERAR